MVKQSNSEAAKEKPARTSLTTDYSVAIVHDYFIWDGGGEKVVKALTEVFPAADVYTGLILPGFKGWLPKNVKTTWVQKLPFLKWFYPAYELLLPFAFESLNLQDYDVIISSTSIFAKGVIGKPTSRHISYIHCPPRFLWGMEPSRQGRIPKIFRLPVKFINNLLRIWDYSSAQRPDILVANSEDIRARIKKAYRRDSIVINPPIDTPPPAETIDQRITSNLQHLPPDGYYLYLGRLVDYKKVDVIIDTFKKLPNLNLVIAGTGDMEESLKEKARGLSNIIFTGRVDESEKWELYKKAKATIHINHEDFGIVPVESMMAGTPVIGLNKGGTKETVINGKTGILIEEPAVEDLEAAIKKFEKMNPSQLSSIKESSVARGNLYTVAEFKRCIKSLTQ